MSSRLCRRGGPEPELHPARDLPEPDLHPGRRDAPPCRRSRKFGLLGGAWLQPGHLPLRRPECHEVAPEALAAGLRARKVRRGRGAAGHLAGPERFSWSTVGNLSVPIWRTGGHTPPVPHPGRSGRGRPGTGRIQRRQANPSSMTVPSVTAGVQGRGRGAAREPSKRFHRPLCPGRVRGPSCAAAWPSRLEGAELYPAGSAMPGTEAG